MDIDKQQFGMADLKQVIGRTDSTIQNWRTRGHITDGVGGWRVFSARDILRIAIFAKLVDLSIPPSDATAAMTYIDETANVAMVARAGTLRVINAKIHHEAAELAFASYYAYVTVNIAQIREDVLFSLISMARSRGRRGRLRGRRAKNTAVSSDS